MARLPRGTKVAVVRLSELARALWIAVLGSIALVYVLLRSRFGLALAAIPDIEVASESQGIHVHHTKFWVYVIAAFGFGVAGAL